MNTGFFDGSAHFIRENVAPAILKALITRNGGESVGPEQIDKDE